MTLPANLTDLPILLPLKRIFYSRKILLLVVAVFVAILGELGLPADIVDLVEKLVVWIIGSWTVKDVASKLANGKK